MEQCSLFDYELIQTNYFSTEVLFMKSGIKDIAERICALREIMGFSAEEMAQATKTSVEEYMRMERGESDFSFIFLLLCAQKLEVELVALLTGENPHLARCAYTKAGTGLPHKRGAENLNYFHLAANLRHKLAEPFLVQAPYSDEVQGMPIHLSTHPGQEFDYVLKGSLLFTHEGHTRVIHEGDSVMYDSGMPHGMIATGGEDCLFLAVIISTKVEDEEA